MKKYLIIGLVLIGALIAWRYALANIVVIDFLGFSNSSAQVLGNGFTSLGQTFTASQTAKITSALFNVSKTGSPTGTAHAVLYNISGTYGTDAQPTGSPLATSDGIDISTYSTSYATSTFTFSSANQYQMTAGTHYAIEFNCNSCTMNGTDGLNITSSSGGSHSGNWFIYFGSYLASGGTDIQFYVYGDTVSSPAPINLTSATAMQMGMAY